MIQAVLKKLVSIKSISPYDGGCQEYLIDFLERLGFVCERFNNPPVSNFFARYGTKQPLLVFAGHTDVVPVDDSSEWFTDPFVLTERNGLLCGRGTTDMKGSLASMLLMVEYFLKDNPSFPGSLGFLITSGEEGDDCDKGTPYVLDQLQNRGTYIDHCVVGEPSSHRRIGDVIRVGRRGSLNATVTLSGKAGHVAYPNRLINPIHEIGPVLAALTDYEWRDGNEHFPPTSLQITHIHSDSKATNVTPHQLIMKFNFRFSSNQNQKSLTNFILKHFKAHGLKPEISLNLSAQPFLTSLSSDLMVGVTQAISKITGHHATFSTDGGTSDARYIAAHGIDVIELGPLNETIHQANEGVSLADLYQLSAIYYAVCCQMLT